LSWGRADYINLPDVLSLGSGWSLPIGVPPCHEGALHRGYRQSTGPSVLADPQPRRPWSARTSSPGH